MNGSTDPNQLPDGPGNINTCAPLKQVIVSVVRCDNGDPITIFTASDGQGNFLPITGQGNKFYICCAPDYKFRVAASGMVTKDVTVTQKDITSGFLTVCLDQVVQKPPAHPCAHICCFSVVALGLATFGLDSAEEGEALAFAPTLRQFRDVVASTRLGATFVDLYYDERVSQPVAEALRKNPSLALRFMVLLLDAWPLVVSFTLQDDSGDRRRAGMPTLRRPTPVLTHRCERNIELWLNDLAKVVPKDVVEVLQRVQELLRQAVNQNAGSIVHSEPERRFHCSQRSQWSKGMRQRGK
jgi:hypothetical protein